MFPPSLSKGPAERNRDSRVFGPINTSRLPKDKPHPSSASNEKSQITHTFNREDHMTLRSKLIRLGLFTAGGLLMQHISGQEASAQGCVVARQSVPVVGPTMMTQSIDVCEGEPWWSPRRWSVATGYRNQHSHRHYVGTVEQTIRAEERTEVNNKVNLLDFAVSYQINSRWSANFSVPLFIA